MSNTDNKKVSLFSKLRYIFDRKQKGQLVVLAVLILIGGIFETFSVSMMIPVMTGILDPSAMQDVIDDYSVLRHIVDFFNLGVSAELAKKLAIANLLKNLP